MERERQSSNTKRAYGIVRDHQGPTIEAFKRILAHYAPVQPREVRIPRASVGALLALAYDGDKTPGPMYLERIPVRIDERVGAETAIIVIPQEDRIPKLVFWVWGSAAAKGGPR
jgi:hypothetical protein